MHVQVYSSAIDYPVGGWKLGLVRQYSRRSRCYLVVDQGCKDALPEWLDFRKTPVKEVKDEDERRALLEKQATPAAKAKAGQKVKDEEGGEEEEGEEEEPAMLLDNHDHDGHKEWKKKYAHILVSL